MKKYSIVRQNKKNGLVNDKGAMILQPIYTSLQIANEDVDVVTLIEVVEREYNFNDNRIGEHNCLIVTADGKRGLLSQSGMVSEIKYDLVIKLTYRHYLCKEQAIYTLYDHLGYSNMAPQEFDTLKPLASFSVREEFTLKGILKTLADTHPQVYADLSRSLYKGPGGDFYISEYRYYYFDDHVYDMWYTVARQRVVIDNDFAIIPLDVV